ncbi:uncharacterized protein LY89DRAFT_330529 [Mollisia scopiformis]|uniref:Uncharacterized protein n=1 Tax=Mollisia scopiformis TaxID=149040 RepID=A0A132B9U9_MOLSC|nr:uncharacterized protein LY89DRAFT_330529 [Mollisia scopiformis]KUJ08447.1 hypothetical protein LY89DRAFT_330529 [Mollisia scopiformis]
MAKNRQSCGLTDSRNGPSRGFRADRSNMGQLSLSHLTVPFLRTDRPTLSGEKLLGTPASAMDVPTLSADRLTLLTNESTPLADRLTDSSSGQTDSLTGHVDSLQRIDQLTRRTDSTMAVLAQILDVRLLYFILRCATKLTEGLLEV